MRLIAPAWHQRRASYRMTTPSARRNRRQRGSIEELLSGARSARASAVCHGKSQTPAVAASPRSAGIVGGRSPGCPSGSTRGHSGWGYGSTNSTCVTSVTGGARWVSVIASTCTEPPSSYRRRFEDARTCPAGRRDPGVKLEQHPAPG